MLEIVPATESHAIMLAATLRAADALEAQRGGVDAWEAVGGSWRRAVLRRAGLVDGEVAAMWGVGGDVLGTVGRPWLLTAPACERVSAIRFARVYRGEVHEMAHLFPMLENWCDAGYTAALRLLAMMGFTVEAPQPFGVMGALFCRFWMRSRHGY